MKAVLVVSDRDNVATALEPLDAGRTLDVDGRSLRVRQPIPSGHKVALREIAAGEAVIKYGSAIGVADAAISAGDHVHVHNLSSTRGRGDRAPAATRANGEPAAERGNGFGSPASRE